MDTPYKCFLVICSVLIIFSMGLLYSQEQRRPESVFRSFQLEMAVFPSSDEGYSEVDVIVWIQNSQLQFRKKNSEYLSRYQINLEINTKNGSSLLTKDTTLQVIESKYSETISMSILRKHQFRFRIKPGEYLIKTRLLDLNSGGTSLVEREQSIPAFDGNRMELSDFYIKKIDSSEGTRQQEIIHAMQVPRDEQSYMYVILQSPQHLPEIEIKLYVDQNGVAQQTLYSGIVQPKSRLNPIFIKLHRENLPRGFVTLKLVASSQGETAEKTKRVRFISGKGSWQADLFEIQPTPLMVEQLQLVARGDEWKQIKKATGEEQEVLFRQFWDRRDPTPLSEENELFQEYYKRVQITNIRFGYNRMEGWKTDRGKVYIIYGSPDAIEQSAPMQYHFAEYEIWYYNELRKKFVFYDEQGTGNMKLVSGNLYSY